MDNIPEETAKTLCNVAEVEFQRCIERKNQLENKAGVCIGAMVAILMVLLQVNTLYVTDIFSLTEKVIGEEIFLYQNKNIGNHIIL